MGFTIRKVGEEDAPSVIALLNPIIASGRYTIMVEPVSVQEQLDYIRSNGARGLFNVAVADDGRTILGIQSVDPVSPSEPALRHVGDVSTFVAIGRQSQGIGGALSRATFRQAKEAGFLKIMATIRADNPAGVAFYTGQGFRVIGTAHRHAFIQGAYIDEIIAEKLLD